MKNTSFNKISLLTVAIILMLAACKKKEYYLDGGISRQSEAELKMTAYEFLASRPNHVFDSLVKIIDLADAKAIVNQSNITFYAVPNEGVMRFQRRFSPSDRQAPRPLVKIGVDTLRMLLNRFIIPSYNVSLEQAVVDKLKYYKDNNGDSLNIYGKGGGINAGSSIQTSAFNMEYEHRKIKVVDSINYVSGIQTHNLQTANARIHVLTPGSNFAGGLKLKYFRVNDN
ncbi:hypothetical protein [Pedobacter metabolipauper]|uniref:Fasciclin domain-containing protein n=1 Tax=Pedobacter metabolipauper TaxID=425513 RepID=A0A4R6SRV6_9SPHI|nr:hypothetical protein [Pedobacter metabolipauper]TDQ07333.1 hypothetical protein ATK78_3454 [Pedobacter metabolipauper]